MQSPYSIIALTITTIMIVDGWEEPYLATNNIKNQFLNNEQPLLFILRDLPAWKHVDTYHILNPLLALQPYVTWKDIKRQ